MKKSLLSFLILMLSISLFSNAFAQEITGGSADGYVLNPDAGTSDPEAILQASTQNPETMRNCNHFTGSKRNNGNGWGVCGGQSQIRLATTMQGEYPDLVQILSGNKSFLNHGRIKGETNERGYVSYCVPDGNIPPSLKLTLVFATKDGGCKTIIE